MIVLRPKSLVKPFLSRPFFFHLTRSKNTVTQKRPCVLFVHRGADGMILLCQGGLCAGRIACQGGKLIEVFLQTLGDSRRHLILEFRGDQLRIGRLVVDESIFDHNRSPTGIQSEQVSSLLDRIMRNKSIVHSSGGMSRKHRLLYAAGQTLGEILEVVGIHSAGRTIKRIVMDAYLYLGIVIAGILQTLRDIQILGIAGNQIRISAQLQQLLIEIRTNIVIQIRLVDQAVAAIAPGSPTMEWPGSIEILAPTMLPLSGGLVNWNTRFPSLL